MLIAIDHGNKQMKTIHSKPFVSGLMESITRPFGSNILEYQGKFYTPVSYTHLRAHETDQ